MELCQHLFSTYVLTEDLTESSRQQYLDNLPNYNPTFDVLPVNVCLQVTHD